MRYSHILTAVHEELWALRDDKLHAILDFLHAQAAGEKFSAQEIEARIDRQTERQVARTEGNVAVLPLHGVIANRMSMFDDISGGISSERFGRNFQAAVRDSSVKAIIIDGNTPGGAVSGTAELSSMIYSARGTKPIVCHVNATLASAGFWIGSAADEIVVTPTGMVGSVGILAVVDDISGALDKAGVKKQVFKAGDFKGDGLPFSAMSEEAQARLQASVEKAYDLFVEDLARNRGVSAKKVREDFGKGAMVDATDALRLGMVDRIGTLEETLQRFGVSQYGSLAQPAAAKGMSRQRAALDL